VNANVNAAIIPRTDAQQWGTEERWDFAESGLGDCEDYALLKRSWLTSGGLPRQALRLTVVTDPDGNGHAVLMVLTDRGDLILDNMTDEIRPDRETAYNFIKREAATPSGWEYLKQPDRRIAAR